LRKLSKKIVKLSKKLKIKTAKTLLNSGILTAFNLAGAVDGSRFCHYI